jgi:RND family efflux transporter MFP subunit
LHIVALAALLATTVLVPGCRLLPKEELQEVPTLLPPPEERRRLVQVVRGYIAEEMRKTARAEAVREEFLYFTQSGRVKDVFVEYGQWVEEGEVLAALETGDLEYNLQRARLDLESAEISLKKTKLERELGGNVSDLDLRLAEINYERALLSYQRVNEQYEASVLKAPFAGRVTTVAVKTGDEIREYQNLIQISDPYNLQLVVEVTVSDLDKLQPGLPLRLEYTRGQWVTGRITKVPKRGDRLPDGEQDRRVLIELDDPDLEFQFRALHSIVILVRENPDALKIDRAGIREYFGRVYVRKVEGDLTTEVNVVTGIESTTEVEILEGLEEGDLVVAK